VIAGSCGEDSKDADEDERLMSIPVPFLSDEVIERDAAALLAEYAQARGVTVKLPIPIEDIVEKHLKLRVEFDDTHKLFGIPRDPECDADILGAIFFDEARIVVDESLDPEEKPAPRKLRLHQNRSENRLAEAGKPAAS
jgi:hypothetical protein